jgi:hypothetical protein
MLSARFAVLSIAVLLAGCGSKQETATTATQAPPPAAQPAAVAPVTTSSAAPAAQPATSGALASADGEKPGTRVDILELKRTSGGTLNLKFALVNNSDKRLAVSAQWLGDQDLTVNAYRNVSGIHLIDPVNKKKYFVITDAEKKCVCSTEVADVEPGGKVNLWAKFPAPPTDVQKVSIEVPHFQPIDDVPIQ